MKNLFVYEIVAAKSKDSSKDIEFALLTESGFDGEMIRFEIYSTDLILRTSSEDICLKKVSPEIIKRLKNGSEFSVINLEKEQVEKIKMVT